MGPQICRGQVKLKLVIINIMPYISQYSSLHYPWHVGLASMQIQSHTLQHGMLVQLEHNINV